MKERPILFNGAMVRAILSGQKTQTRRMLKPQPELQSAFIGGFMQKALVYKNTADPEGWLMHKMCPYGQPGDRLWVRETIDLRTLPGNSFLSPVYRADGSHVMDGTHKASNHEFMKRRVHPSIHMPRWACRIVLEIVSVRVERLQDISRGDAMDEGCPFPNMADGDDPRQWFAGLWQTINGHESWQANPWVWVVEFKEVAA